MSESPSLEGTGAILNSGPPGPWSSRQMERHTHQINDRTATKRRAPRKQPRLSEVVILGGNLGMIGSVFLAAALWAANPILSSAFERADLARVWAPPAQAASI